jgi:hypothetical protein
MWSGAVQEVAMNAAMQAQHQVSDREAVRWIARQLRWERTLGVLRGDEHAPAASERKAA